MKVPSHYVIATFQLYGSLMLESPDYFFRVREIGRLRRLGLLPPPRACSVHGTRSCKWFLRILLTRTEHARGFGLRPPLFSGVKGHAYARGGGRAWERGHGCGAGGSAHLTRRGGVFSCSNTGISRHRSGKGWVLCCWQSLGNLWCCVVRRAEKAHRG